MDYRPGLLRFGELGGRRGGICIMVSPAMMGGGIDTSVNQS